MVRTTTRTSRLQVELLEGRTLPALVEWINPAGGDWAVPENWSTGQLPSANDDVLIDLPPDFSVIHSQGASTVRSLLSRETLVLSGGSLDLATDSNMDGPFELSGGILDGSGTLTLHSAFSWTAGTIRGRDADARFVANGFSALDGPTPKMLVNRVLEFTRSVDVRGGPLVMNQATFLVSRSGLLEAQRVQFLQQTPSRFTNEGTARMWGGGEIATHWVENNGAVEVHGERLDFGISRGVASSDGSFHLTAQADVRILADFIDVRGPVWGSGSLLLRGGVSVGLGADVDLDGNVSIGGGRSARVTGTVRAAALGVFASDYFFGGAVEAASVRLSATGDGAIRGTITAGSLLLESGYTIMADATVAAEIFENRATLELWDSVVTAGTLFNARHQRFFLQRNTEVTAATFMNLGWLNGTGTIRGDVINDGWVVIGGLYAAGVLTIEGNFIQAGGGELIVWLGGTEPGTGHSQLQVNGLAILGGRLVVRLADGYTPQVGDRFDVLTFTARVGGFESFTVPSYDEEVILSPTYDGAGLALFAIRR